MVVMGLLFDILVFLHHPPLRGVPWLVLCFLPSMARTAPSFRVGCGVGKGDKGISRQDLWDELWELFRLLTTPTHRSWIS